MSETSSVSFVDLIALQPLGKGTEKYLSGRQAFNATGMLDYLMVPHDST